ncbi:hypothetical protein DFS33DRAFT_1278374 [Desarmillaria ectypa]|nr:hypothetical protein DFS33DRAFT_1278374 [Desarmillaria ectypa]
MSKAAVGNSCTFTSLPFHQQLLLDSLVHHASEPRQQQRVNFEVVNHSRCSTYLDIDHRFGPAMPLKPGISSALDPESRNDDLNDRDRTLQGPHVLSETLVYRYLDILKSGQVGRNLVEICVKVMGVTIELNRTQEMVGILFPIHTFKCTLIISSSIIITCKCYSTIFDILPSSAIIIVFPDTLLGLVRNQPPILASNVLDGHKGVAVSIIDTALKFRYFYR